MGMLFGSGRKIGNAAPDCGRWCSTPSRRWFRQPGIYLAALIGFALPMLVLLALLTAHSRTGLLTRFFTAVPPTWDQTQDPFDFSPMLEILTKRGDLQGVDLIATRNWITAGLMSTGLQGNWPIRVYPNQYTSFSSYKVRPEPGRCYFLIHRRPPWNQSV